MLSANIFQSSWKTTRNHDFNSPLQWHKSHSLGIQETTGRTGLVHCKKNKQKNSKKNHMESERLHATQSKPCTIGFTFKTGYHYGVSSCRHRFQCLMCITLHTWWLENTCGLTLWYLEVETSGRPHSGYVCKSLGYQLGSFTLSQVIQAFSFYLAILGGSSANLVTSLTQVCGEVMGTSSTYLPLSVGNPEHF